MQVKAIVFDEGDCLYDVSFWRKELYKKLVELGFKASFVQMVEAWEAKLVLPYQGKKSYAQAFEEFLSELGFSEKQQQEIKQFSDGLKEIAPKKRKVFPNVANTLASLKKQGIGLAILSDSEIPEPEHRKALAKLGLENFFDTIVCSCEIGYAKPEPKAYLLALERLGAKPEQSLFVSHDQEELDGAKKAGLKAVAFNDLVYSDKKAEADFRIKDFSELLEIANRLNSPAGQ